MNRIFRLAVTSFAACGFLACTYAIAQVKVGPQAKQVDRLELRKQDAKEEERGKTKAKPAMKAAPAAKAVVERRVMIRAMAAPAANVAALEQQFTQQVRPVLHAELLFLRSVCDLTFEQRRALSKESDQVLKDAVTPYVEAQQQMMRGVAAQYPDTRKVLQQSLEKAVKKHLSPEQATRYHAELEKRATEWKDAGVRLLVAKMDENLVLSSDQREKISKSLFEHWNDSWTQVVEMLQQNDQVFPMIPNQHVAPYLNASQKRVWDGMPKNNYNFSFAVGFFDGNVNNAEDPLADPDDPKPASQDLPKDVFESNDNAAPKRDRKPAGAINAAPPVRLRVIER